MITSGAQARKPASTVLLRWKDVVVTVGGPGSERILLAAADLEVVTGETVWVSAADAETRAAIVALLDGTKSPLYGAVTALAQPTGTDVRLIVADAANSADLTASALTREDGATIVVAPTGPRATPGLAAPRWLSVENGALRPAGNSRRWPVGEVRERVIDLFAEAGADREDARIVAEVLVDANVQGRDSLGVRLVPEYLDRMRDGVIDVTAKPRWIINGGVVNALSGAGCFGPLAARAAAELCAAQAIKHGLAAVAVRDNGHAGMLAAYRFPFIKQGVTALILGPTSEAGADSTVRRLIPGTDMACVIVPQQEGPEVLIAEFAMNATAHSAVSALGGNGDFSQLFVGLSPAAFRDGNIGWPTAALTPLAAEDDGREPRLALSSGVAQSLGLIP